MENFPEAASHGSQIAESHRSKNKLAEDDEEEKEIRKKKEEEMETETNTAETNKKTQTRKITNEQT